jgi:hypothetical protein
VSTSSGAPTLPQLASDGEVHVDDFSLPTAGRGSLLLTIDSLDNEYEGAVL